jgi:hypothetical protein
MSKQSKVKVKVEQVGEVKYIPPSLDGKYSPSIVIRGIFQGPPPEPKPVPPKPEPKKGS